jgi:hypothetical protein
MRNLRVADVEEYSERVSSIPTPEFGPADPSGARSGAGTTTDH